MCGRSGMATVFTLQFRYTTLGNSCSITCNYTAIELQCTRSSVAVPVHALHCTQSSARDTVHPLQCTRTIRQNACAQEHALQCTSSSVRPTVHALQCTRATATVHTLQCTSCYCTYYGSVPKLYCNHNEISLFSACIVAQDR